MANYFIFRCSKWTHQECLDRELFGQGDDMGGFVSNVKIGDILFLHNITSQTIEGPFFAVSNGTRNIVEEAWKKQGGFPQQVKVVKKGKISEIKKILLISLD